MILTIKDSAGREFKIDKHDYTKFGHITWSVEKRGYVINVRRPGGKKKVTYLHRVIMDPKDGLVVDHIDGDKSNNSKSNLRVCTEAQNSRNRKVLKKNKTSRYLGVRYKTGSGRRKRWSARITFNGKEISLGIFLTQEEAAFAYDMAAKKYFGSFANINFK